MAGKRPASVCDPSNDSDTSESRKMYLSSVIGISRSISACKRCRQKKIKCSHDFPKCKACLRANVDCVSIDPATGREIPRSYIVHLESKVELLERQLKELNGDSEKPDRLHTPESESENERGINRGSRVDYGKHESAPSMMDKVEMFTADSGSIAPSSFFGDSSGISFAKLMFAAINFKGAADTTGSGPRKVNHRHSFVDPSMMKVTAPDSRIALMPPKQQALNLLSLYFAQSNSQLPIFHREVFLRKYFQPLYGDIPENTHFASTYTSINRSVLIHVEEKDTWYYQYTQMLDQDVGRSKDFDPFRFSAAVKVPSKFHKPLYFMNIVFAIASSVIHLQYPEEISDEFKNSALRYIDHVYSSSDRCEALQAILCLTLYSLMRPCVPGCWYLLGSSLRLAVDLGLHWETEKNDYDAFTLDIRRRLFWSCYSLDRQICIYLGRPFGIPEECCHVPFPSDLDDSLIILGDGRTIQDYSTRTSCMPSYKSVSLTMFRIRKLQAEIKSILYDKKELPRKFRNLQEWYRDISNRLDVWFESIPKTKRKMNCDFNYEFFNLNLNHARIMLNGLSPVHYNLNLENYMELVDASMDMIISYYELYTYKLLNYTWAATHNLFMAGTSFLYSVFNCEEARKSAPLSEVQKVVSYCNLVLASLKDKCDVASQCKDVFEILTAAVIKLRYTENIVHSSDISKIPSTEQVAMIQPGRHLPENVRNLVSSLPASMREAASRDENYSSQSDLLSLESTAGNLGAFKWSTNEAELNRFFDELQKIDSPESSTRSFENSDSVSPSYSSTNPSVSAFPTDNLRRQSLNYGQSNYKPLEYHSTSMSRSHTYTEGSQKGSAVAVRHSASTFACLPQKVESSSDSPIRSFATKTSKEGQRVFKMIHLLPTESIWDQFFASGSYAKEECDDEQKGEAEDSNEENGQHL
ncbi:DEKNAAC100022 [Brettanomyces naardenensis]|uniref:DEKNAAC100022 n=1 Tax=Brettanomyces naardenensis TaxID=13370 RepID=A0A448YGC4_BRENA|nr:DEKNAAC100022 [Brettanomyces naardenensis]